MAKTNWGMNETVMPADMNQIGQEINETAEAVGTLQDGAVLKDGSTIFTGQIKSSLPTGTAPFSVASTTVVPNLNADMVDGRNAETTSAPNTVAARNASGILQASRYVSDVAQGTAPFTVTSTTMVANLNADLLDGYHALQGATANTVAVRDANAALTSARFISNAAQGTAPLSVVSTTVVTNLNADSVDGYHATDNPNTPLTVAVRNSNGILGSLRFYSSVEQGTSPLVVDSSTLVAKLNADMVDGMHVSVANAADTIMARSSTGGVEANVFNSKAATGTAPLTVLSTTVVANLNTDMVDGLHASDLARGQYADNYKGPTDLPSTYPNRATTTFFVNNVTGWPQLYGTVVTIKGYTSQASIQYFYPYNNDAPIKFRYALYNTDAWLAWRDVVDSTGAAAFTGQINSSVATGTAPFSVASTTVVTNLNADSVDGFHLNQDLRTTATPLFAALKVAAATASPFTVERTSNTVNAAIEYKTTGSSVFAGHGAASRFAVGVDANLSAAPFYIDVTTGDVTGRRFASSVATGTAPFVVASTTVVANLNADMLDGKHAFQFVEDTDNVYFEDKVSSYTFIARAEEGTSPFAISSTTRVVNLNADMVDGYHFNQDLRTTAAPTFDGLTLSGGLLLSNADDIQAGAIIVGTGIFEVAGAPPFTVYSPMRVTNLNADMVDSMHVSVANSANSIVARDANLDITVRRLISSAAIGTSPFSVTSTTLVTNLNADLLDGYHGNMNATANTVAVRGTNGTLNVGTPTASAHAANLDYVENVAIHNHRYDYAQHPRVASTGGFSDAYTVTAPFANYPFPTGFGLVIKPHEDNLQGASIQVSGANSSPDIPIYDSTMQPIKAGAMKANGMYSLRYNGTAFILQGEGGDSGGGGTVVETYSASRPAGITGVSAPTGLTSAITALANGKYFSVYIHANNGTNQSQAIYLGQKANPAGTAGFNRVIVTVSGSAPIATVNDNLSAVGPASGVAGVTYKLVSY
jgi:hypothetical protein